MCNLCSGRLFLVPNPCCCCELRCGVLWTGVGDIVAGLMSLYFPLTISVKEKNDLTHTHSHGDADEFGDKLDSNQQAEDMSPVFDISVPFLERNNFITHCCLLEIVSGIMIICAAYGMGSHIFSRFLLGCSWMFFRILIVAFELTLIKHLLKYDHGPLMRYTFFVSLHTALDVYLFIIVRYYTMECYDSYRYQKIITRSLQIRREAPNSSKAAPKTRSGIGKQKKKAKGKTTSKVETEKNVVQVRDIFQKRRDSETGAERVPVWDRKNEVIFYGEDYTDWDPSVFQARWEMLNEKDKQEKIESSKRNVASVAFDYLLKANQDVPMHSQSEERIASMTTALEQFARRSNNSDRTNSGSTAGASEHFGRRSIKSQSINAGSKAGAPARFGQRSSRSKSASYIPNTHKPNAEDGGQEVDDKGFHWSRSNQRQSQLQPFKPVIQRPPRKPVASRNDSVLHKLRKEVNEKKH